MWMDAAGQIFYSVGVGFGTLTLFSTGNKPKNNCYMDAIMCALGNCGTSLWASIIMFSLFGFKADYEVNKCEMNRNTSLGANSSKPISCSTKADIFKQVSGRGFFLPELAASFRSSRRGASGCAATRGLSFVNGQH